VKTVVELLDPASRVDYPSFKARQAMLLKLYEDGESERERIMQLEQEKRDVIAQKATLSEELSRLKTQEKTARSSLEAMTDKFEQEKEKNQKLRLEMKQMKKTASEDAKKQIDDLRSENNDLKGQLRLLREDLESSNKRQKINEDSGYVSRATPSDSNHKMVTLDSIVQSTMAGNRTFSFNIGH